MYQGVRGAPVIFTENYFDELMKLTGDEGAKNILRSSRKPITEIPIMEGAFDIDSVADLSVLRLTGEREPDKNKGNSINKVSRVFLL